MAYLSLHNISRIKITKPELLHEFNEFSKTFSQKIKVYSTNIKSKEYFEITLFSENSNNLIYLKKEKTEKLMRESLIL